MYLFFSKHGIKGREKIENCCPQNFIMSPKDKLAALSCRLWLDARHKDSVESSLSAPPSEALEIAY